MIYPVTVFGDPVLRKKAQPITKDFQDLKGFIQNMFDTMYNSDGVGLAAPQVGQAVRIFVIDSDVDDEDELPGIKKAFINPEIVEKSGEEWVMNEGCLSLPEIREDVLRPETVKIKYVDEEFNEHIETYSGFTSRVIQHEYDHLEGVMFVDYLNPLRKRILKSKLSAISKGKVIPKYRIKVPGK
ncbi:peptide deformylase [Aquipluma nitroreducens]|uniref:Peptide deformylase n=1 Tax=Aquipluma nitroreducens TaxID=2010828 RepID=A0A5K7S4E5_9BACT|nr:peptide deformylase [Aquipluma nitroreducens]BBE16396.1 peptide deformylase [Aquipluma nitroreducens]